MVDFGSAVDTTDWSSGKVKVGSCVLTYQVDEDSNVGSVDNSCDSGS